VRLNWSGKIDGGFHAQVGNAVLHDFEINGDDASHLNGTAEGDFAISL
jgi:hypothetical protein